MNIYRFFVGHRTRIHYWGCSKFADWCRSKTTMTKKPKSASAEGWDQWTADVKDSHPISNWIIEEGLDSAQSIAYFPYDVYRNIKTYVLNRWIDKTHLIDTKLSKGQWHETNEVLLHGIMERLVQFIEGEKAHMYDLGGVWGEDDFVPIKSRREAGIAHLDWEIAIVHLKEELTEEHYDLIGKSTSQSLAASEQKEIYIWWKDVYPNRPDSMDESGWTEHCDNKREDGISILGVESPEEQKKTRAILKICNEIDERYADEETDMLIRVIKIRAGLWT